MARKTNSSGESLASTSPPAGAANEKPKRGRPRTRHLAITPNKQSGKPKRGRKPKTTNVSSNDEEDGADADTGGSDDEDADENDNNGTKPAAIAPSVRATGVHGEQAGHFTQHKGNGGDTSYLTHSPYQDDADVESAIRGKKSRNASKRSSLNANLDDDDYDAVNWISDSDEDEDPDVERSEERNIIESEEADVDSSLPAAAPSAASDAEARWDPYELTDGSLLTDGHFFDEHFGYTDPSVHAETDFLSSTSIFEGFSPPPVDTSSTRQVRFLTPAATRSDASDIISDDGDVNTLFSHDNGGAGFAGQNFSSQHEERRNEEDEVGSACGSSSGYETDYGETTDEEDVPATALATPQAIHRRPSVNSMGSVHGPFKVPTTPASHRYGPRMGLFTTDARKPVAILDGTGKNLVIFPAKRPSSVKTSLARVPGGNSSSAPMTPITSHPILGAITDVSDSDYNDLASQISVDPILSIGPNLTGAGLARGVSANAATGPQPTSPSLIFAPLDSMEDPGNYLLTDDEDEAVNDEDMLNIGDFIHLGEDTSDEDGADESATSPTFASESDTKPAAGLTQTSSSSLSSTQDLLKHFDTGVITAFRRGQNQHQAHSMQRRPTHGLSLSMSAMKTGKHGSTAPFPSGTPKKRKLSDSLGAGVGLDVANKRQLCESSVN